MWEKVKKHLAEWIPEHISPRLVVGVYRLLDLFCIIRKDKINDNFEHNIKLLQAVISPLREGFIENQNEWGSIHFGKTTMAFSGCEIMAVYNALCALGHEGGPELICKLISEFEKKGAALQGWIGTSPWAVRKYLEKQGIRTRLVWDEKKLADVNVAIATLYNDRKDIYSQIHTVTFTRGDNGYTIHNAPGCKQGCGTLKEAIEGVTDAAKMICAIEIVESNN